MFGNLLIIVVLTVNKRMRTVTNSFLLSLAVSDLMMAIFCMPFTLIPNLLEDFIFGPAMCKIVAYLMGKNGGREMLRAAVGDIEAGENIDLLREREEVWEERVMEVW